MFKLLRIGVFALPLVAGTAWAQGSGTSGSSGGPTVTPPVTNDTRTPLQQKAGKLDDTVPALPGDATQPTDIPNTVKDSDRSAMPDSTGMTTPGSGATDQKVQKKQRTPPPPKSKSDESTLERKSDVEHDATKIDNRAVDPTKDQLNSDK
jgi:hypothetical protein